MGRVDSIHVMVSGQSVQCAVTRVGSVVVSGRGETRKLARGVGGGFLLLIKMSRVVTIVMMMVTMVTIVMMMVMMVTIVMMMGWQ